MSSTQTRSWRKPIVAGLIASLIALSIWSLNYLLIGRPVANELATDVRNDGYTLKAHYQYYLDMSTLVLDLRDVKSAAPADLFRGLFQSAEALHKSSRQFDCVVLSHSGSRVFLIGGDDFATIGSEYAQGQNPVYLIRTLPEKLRRPDGAAAFGSWEGGLLGVLGKQIDDANEAARQWVSG